MGLGHLPASHSDARREGVPAARRGAPSRPVLDPDRPRPSTDLTALRRQVIDGLRRAARNGEPGAAEAVHAAATWEWDDLVDELELQLPGWTGARHVSLRVNPTWLVEAGPGRGITRILLHSSDQLDTAHTH